MRFSTIALPALATLVAGAAWAAATPPAKPVPAAFYSGRWYEIARTPNSGQRNCQAPTTDFTAQGTNFKVRQVCHRGSPRGAQKVFRTSGKILPGGQNNRFTMSFLGGLKKQEYWILDSAADDSWGIMATPGGNYVWLLSRTPDLPAATKAVALEKVKALGYQKLEYPEHPA
ncbi:lipocalin family protein [Caulobacter sp. RHG1]|uniref:lipocalin family protein n=1 Tax=Caulobacter sp. (strain RHG1) TaxID=2545762 RepID=UPI001553CDEF|nr:lipocalin family protein [Caulobacter sp. RHG1]NQE65235.1 Outer membrane lipoprotein Blc [Caulobacter sp. RHG1]